MARDPGLAQTLRDDLGDLPVTEQKMFGGLCFLLHGHMICGTLRDGALFRVGKPNMATALSPPGARPMVMGARTMAGFVELGGADLQDTARRAPLMALAIGFVKTLPPK